MVMPESQIYSFPPKSTLFREGEETNEMYIIISGNVRIIKAAGGGKNLILAELGPGAMIGEMSLISGRPRSATAQAISEVKVKVITKNIFQKSAAGVPAWAMCIAKVLIERLRQTNIVLRKNANIDVFQNVKTKEIEFTQKFTINYNESENPNIAFLKGYFFSHDIKDIDIFINKILRKKIRKISLDFSEVIDIDAPAIEFLIDCAKRLKRSNIKFTMHNVQLIHTKLSTNTTLKDVISTLSPPRKNIPANTYLIKQGDLSDTMFIIKSGRFKITRLIDNREISFAEIGAGDVIGEMTLIAGGKRSASVKAIKPSIVYVITHTDILNNKFNIPNWFLKIIQQLITRIRDSDAILDKIVKREGTAIDYIGIEIDYMPDKSMSGIFKLKGELIPRNRLFFKNQIIRLIESGFYNIILDFSNINVMDMSYIALLNEISAKLVSKKGKLHFINTNTRISAMIKEGITFTEGKVVHDGSVNLDTPVSTNENFDTLTGLYSRDYFTTLLEEEIERSKRYKSVLSVLSIGIDPLSEENSVKPSNSFMQKEIAELIKTRFRKVDRAARTGDKLFQIILPGTNRQNAKHVAEEFCKIVNENKFTFNSAIVHLTCSCGIAIFSKKDNAESLLSRSREALFKAKKQGDNKIIALLAE